MNNIAVFYHYFENDLSYKNNLIFFLSIGYREEIDIFIISSSKINFKIPERNNIKIINVINKNLDWGGFSRGLKEIPEKFNYKKVFFINSSSRGPFIPFHFNQPWYKLFTDKLTSDCHFIGSSIKILDESSNESERFGKNFSNFLAPFHHIQTNIYCLSDKLFKQLYDLGIYDDHDKEYDKLDIISNYEIRLSQEALGLGYNLKCLIPEYNQINYLNKIEPLHALIKTDGLINKNVYFERTLHPSELVFVKVNRDVLSYKELSSFTYTYLNSKNQFKEWNEAIELINASYSEIQANYVKRKKRERSLFLRLYNKISELIHVLLLSK